MNNLEDIMLSESGQARAHAHNTIWFHLFEFPTVVKFRDRRIIGVARGWLEGEMGSYNLMGTVFQF